MDRASFICGLKGYRGPINNYGYPMGVYMGETTIEAGDIRSAFTGGNCKHFVLAYYMGGQKVVLVHDSSNELISHPIEILETTLEGFREMEKLPISDPHNVMGTERAFL